MIPSDPLFHKPKSIIAAKNILFATIFLDIIILAINKIYQWIEHVFKSAGIRNSRPGSCSDFCADQAGWPGQGVGEEHAAYISYLIDRGGDTISVPGFYAVQGEPP